MPLSRRCTQSARRRRSRPTLAKITIQWEACKQWLWTRWLVALSSSRPRASNLAVAPTESGGAPFHAPTPQSHVEHSVDSAISLAKRSDSLGRATFFFATTPCGYSRKFCKITRRKRMIHSGRTRLEVSQRRTRSIPRTKCDRGNARQSATRSGGSCVFNVVIAEANS